MPRFLGRIEGWHVVDLPSTSSLVHGPDSNVGCGLFPISNLRVEKPWVSFQPPSSGTGYGTVHVRRSNRMEMGWNPREILHEWGRRGSMDMDYQESTMANEKDRFTNEMMETSCVEKQVNTEPTNKWTKNEGAIQTRGTSR